MALRPRTVYWIVSRHVLIAGFLLPGVARRRWGRFGHSTCKARPAYLSFFAVLAFGYFAGFGNSLAYLRKNALSNQWQQCVAPSIFGFAAALCIFAFAVDLYWLPERNFWTLTGLAVFYSVVLRALSTITKRAFEFYQRRRIG